MQNYKNLYKYPQKSTHNQIYRGQKCQKNQYAFHARKESQTSQARLNLTAQNAQAISLSDAVTAGRQLQNTPVLHAISQALTNSGKNGKRSNNTEDNA